MFVRFALVGYDTRCIEVSGISTLVLDLKMPWLWAGLSIYEPSGALPSQCPIAFLAIDSPPSTVQGPTRREWDS